MCLAPVATHVGLPTLLKKSRATSRRLKSWSEILSFEIADPGDIPGNAMIMAATGRYSILFDIRDSYGSWPTGMTNSGAPRIGEIHHWCHKGCM